MPSRSEIPGGCETGWGEHFNPLLPHLLPSILSSRASSFDQVVWFRARNGDAEREVLATGQLEVGFLQESTHFCGKSEVRKEEVQQRVYPRPLSLRQIPFPKRGNQNAQTPPKLRRKEGFCVRQRSAAATGGDTEVPVRGPTPRDPADRSHQAPLSLGKPPGKTAGVSRRLPLRGVSPTRRRSRGRGVFTGSKPAGRPEAWRGWGNLIGNKKKVR